MYSLLTFVVVRLPRSSTMVSKGFPINCKQPITAAAFILVLSGPVIVLLLFTTTGLFILWARMER
ncbi:hypothetical protein LINPERHAP1_LOCUS35648 [Linum perenne]